MLFTDCFRHPVYISIFLIVAPPGVRMSNPDLRLIIYKTLEEKRGAKIGVPPLKNFNVTRSDSE